MRAGSEKTILIMQILFGSINQENWVKWNTGKKKVTWSIESSRNV